MRFGVSIEEVRLQEEAAGRSVDRHLEPMGGRAEYAGATELVVEPRRVEAFDALKRELQAERLMRVASKLRERTRRRSIQRLAQTFVEQLTEILPVLQPSTNGNGRKRPSQR